MGPQHTYGLAARLEQLADHRFPLNQGTMYAALVRLVATSATRRSTVRWARRAASRAD